MRKEAFLRQLEYLLQDLPEIEREEAMNYYRDYLDEAGSENEEDVLREFGSPERIAAIIRSDVNGNLEDGGSFTEKGYEDERFRDPNFQLTNRMDLPEACAGANHESRQNKEDGGAWHSNGKEYVYEEKKLKPRTNGCLKVILCIILLCVASPFALGMGGAVLGILIGGVVAFGVLLMLVGIFCLIFFFIGIVALVAGIASIMQDPPIAVFVIGVGLLNLGFGCLTLLFSVWFYGKAIPWLFRRIGNGLDAVSERVRGRAQ